MGRTYTHREALIHRQYHDIGGIKNIMTKISWFTNNINILPRPSNLPVLTPKEHRYPSAGY